MNGRNDTEERIQAAMADGGSTDSIRIIKDVVTDDLRRLDGTIDVVRTSYFNHSYMPDLVIEWTEDGRKRLRPYFLRFGPRSREALLDVERLAPLVSDPPVFLMLESEEHPASMDVAFQNSAAEVLSRHPTTLLTEAGATEAMAETVASPGGDEVAEAFVRGGRGYVPESTGRTLAQRANAGFEAVERHDSKSVRQMLGFVQRYVTDEYAQEIEGSLQLSWISSGGNPEAFPGTQKSFALSAERLLEVLRRLVMREEEIEEESFWDRLSPLVSQDMLFALAPVAPNANLQRLIREMAKDIKVVSAAVIPLPVSGDNENESVDEGARPSTVGLSSTVGADAEPSDIAAATPSLPWWSIASSATGKPSLLLTGSRFALDFVEDGRYHNRFNACLPALDVSEAILQLVGYNVESATADTGSVEIRATSKSDRKLTMRELLRSSEGTVSSIVVDLGEDAGKVNADLLRGVFTSTGARRLELPKLGVLALGLASDVTDDDRNELQRGF